MSSKIEVGIRLRPLTKSEKDRNLAIRWIVRENSVISLDPTIRKQEENTFHFDNIFDLDATNLDIFDVLAKPIVDDAINGINGTIFSYGQSNSGKTHTMIGTSEEPGIIPLSIKYIFHTISNITGREFLLRVSYLKVYDETINDLLNYNSTNLELHKDDNGHVLVNCKEEIASSLDTTLSVMEKGCKNGLRREFNRKEHTNGHDIFRITIESQEVDGDSKSVARISQLNLVDLAGFEKTYAIDTVEKHEVDKSLFALRSLIIQLSKSQNDQKDINYCKSKLTEVLQPAVGSDTSTVIICTVVPAALEETRQVLSFAVQARNIKNNPCENETISEQLTKFQTDSQEEKNEKSSVELEEAESRLQERDQVNHLVEERVKLLNDQIVSECNTISEGSFKCNTRRPARPNSGTLRSHIHIFHSRTGLPTINEMSPEKMYNKTFQAAISDFGQDLIECECKIKSESNSSCITPGKQDSWVQTLCNYVSPETPKNVLRQHISDLTRDLVELREFTTLEKQLICEENHCNVFEQLTKRSILCNTDDENNVHCAGLINQLEEEKIKLAEELELKIQELDEIKNDVLSLKLDVEKLQNTIYLLTNENMDMSTKLVTEKERSKEVEFHLQKTVDELYARISRITDEKINLESNLMCLNDQLQSIRSKIPEVEGEEQLFAKYQRKIDELKTENIELTAIIAEKSKELQDIKESKSLLYNHDCIYKDKLASLKEKNDCLVTENNELSTDLIDKIEENDMLKEQCDILKNKVSLINNMNSEENDVNQLKTENNFLRAEILELKMKVTMLSNENVKFSNNLFETIEDCDDPPSEQLHSSNIFNDTTKTNETAKEVLQNENHEALVNKVITLQNNIDHLTRLNEKLSDLKLASCSQCAHLKNLNDSRRALKLEAKILNHKLEDLQRKFDRERADTEALKMKVNQDLNLSFVDTSLNASFVNGINVSFVEEKVQCLSNELQMLKDGRDKLSILYKEKCVELEKLHDEVIHVKNVEEDAKSKKHTVKNECKIDRIQKDIDQVREDIDELKKNSTNFNSMLNKFRTEKVSLLDEINALKTVNEELQQKLSDSEISAATAIEKAHILENDLLHMNQEIEQFSIKEKAIRNEKLTLELEIEDLKAEKENKDIHIVRLHRTIDDLNESISSLKNELDLLASQKNELAVSTESIERKYRDELGLLKQQYEKLEEERKQSTEVENRATLWAKELESDIEKLQTDLNKQENLYKEVQGKVSQLEYLLEENENEKEALKQKLQELEAQVTDSKDNLVIECKNEFESVMKKFEDYTKESEIKLSKINETLNKYIEENGTLREEIKKLRDIELKFNQIKVDGNPYDEEEILINDKKKLKEELDTVRESMIKELMSLRCKVNSMNFLNKSANEIFIIFLQALMSKEEEVIRTMRESFEKDKQKLEDEKRQSADAEKRMTLWTRELETEIEKLQTDLTEREIMHREQQDKIYQLEHLLKEGNYEKEILKEKMETLETDYSNLQAEFDKQCKMDVRQEEAIIIVQKREKEMQEAFKNKEIELQFKVKSENKMHEKRIEELLSTIETYKTKNMELKSNIEGLEANEKQLKNIIEANASELKANNQTIEEMNTNVEQLTEAYNEVNREVEQKTSRIEDITKLLKSKCDMLSEYKAKLETIMPDYEVLKDQVKEWKASIERYKEEIEKLKMEKEKQIEIVKDKLNSEEINNLGLNNQMNELHNKSITLVQELDSLKEKYENLQRVNAKLEKKIRNSTSKVKAEAEMEDLKDQNKRLQSNLEGASNRISELQDNKSKILKELVNLKGQYELLSQENVEMKKALASYKSRQSIPCYLQEDGKYDALLQEKNKVALELESRKILLNQRDKEIAEYVSQVKDLFIKNEELNNQLKEHITIICERDVEISSLKDKLYVHRIENKLVNELEEKLNLLKEEKKKLYDQLETFKTKSRTDTKQIEDIKLHNEKVLFVLRKENSELQAKLDEYENKLELKTHSSSSRSVSPTVTINRRRHSRNEIFNQKRQLEVNESEETCQILRKKIQELELQLVSKNGQIATLEVQIQSENFPYQRKCRELEELLLVYRKKNAELSSETRKLQRTMNDISAWECDICRRLKINRRDQSCQTVASNTLRLLTNNNGEVDEHAKITKLEKEKILLRDLCRSRCRRIKDLEEKVREFEELQTSASGSTESLHEIPNQRNLEKNMKP